jgi:hypothetical protein
MLLLLFKSLLVLLLSLLSESSDKGVVDGDGGEVPFCVIALVVLPSAVSFEVAVNCSFSVFTSFSASVAL